MQKKLTGSDQALGIVLIPNLFFALHSAGYHKNKKELFPLAKSPFGH